MVTRTVPGSAQPHHDKRQDEDVPQQRHRRQDGAELSGLPAELGVFFHRRQRLGLPLVGANFETDREKAEEVDHLHRVAMETSALAQQKAGLLDGIDRKMGALKAKHEKQVEALKESQAKEMRELESAHMQELNNLEAIRENELGKVEARALKVIPEERMNRSKRVSDVDAGSRKKRTRISGLSV